MSGHGNQRGDEDARPRRRWPSWPSRTCRTRSAGLRRGSFRSAANTSSPSRSIPGCCSGSRRRWPRQRWSGVARSRSTWARICGACEAMLSALARGHERRHREGAARSQAHRVSGRESTRKILRAAKILAEEGICRPILLGARSEIEALARDLQLPMDKIDFVNTNRSEKLSAYARRLEELRRRTGVTHAEAARQARVRNVFGPLMLDAGDADGVISGLTQSYPDTIRPALQIVRHGARRRTGLGPLHPDAQEPDVLLRRHHGQHRPDGRGAGRDRDPDGRGRAPLRHRAPVAMLSFSNFGSNTHANALKVKKAVELVKAARPDLADRRRDAGRLRGRARDAGGRVPLGHGPEPQRPDLPGPGVGQRRLQAGLAARRRRGHRPDPPGPGASPCTSSSAASRWPTSSTWPPSPSWTRRRKRRPRSRRGGARPAPARRAAARQGPPLRLPEVSPVV